MNRSPSIVAFTDDDCLPSPGWLRTGLAAFNEDVVGVAGKLIVPLDHTPTDYEYNASMLSKAEFITANCFYRFDALAMVGGFCLFLLSSESSDIFPGKGNRHATPFDLRASAINRARRAGVRRSQERR